MNTKRLLLGLVFLLLVGGLGLWLVSQKSPAPVVSGPSLSGSVIATQALQGKPYLVNFWATSCVTCVKEMPDLKALQDRFGPQGLRVVAVAMSYDKLAFVERFVEERGLPFDVVYDQDGRWAKAFGEVAVTPTTFLVDGQGQLVRRYVGPPDFEQLGRLIQKLL